MFKFYASLIVSIVICMVYSFMNNQTKDKDEDKKDDEYVKRQLILFITVFVITYCISTLVYDGGVGKLYPNKESSFVVDNSKSTTMMMDSLLENVEFGDPPF